MNALGLGLGSQLPSPYQSLPAAQEVLPSPAPRVAAPADPADNSAAAVTAVPVGQLSTELSTSLVLSLTTREGDSITLDFSQFDTFELLAMKGRTLEGDGLRASRVEERSQSLVEMAVDGDLNAAERDSVDAVLAAVIEVANRFFSDDMAAAIEKLKMMDFDTSTLADFSLKMTMSKRVDLATVAGGSSYDGLKRLADRDGQVSRVLEFLADQQRRLIESASEALDRPSAIKLVKSLLPPMLEASLLQLADKVADQEDGKIAKGVGDDAGAGSENSQSTGLLNV